MLAAGLIVAAVTEGGWCWWAGAIAAATLALIGLSMCLRTSMSGVHHLFRRSRYDLHQRPRASICGVTWPAWFVAERSHLTTLLSRLLSDAHVFQSACRCSGVSAGRWCAPASHDGYGRAC